jgi:hypothetical protein
VGRDEESIAEVVQEAVAPLENPIVSQSSSRRTEEGVVPQIDPVNIPDYAGLVNNGVMDNFVIDYHEYISTTIKIMSNLFF